MMDVDCGATEGYLCEKTGTAGPATPAPSAPADCAGLGSGYYNDPLTGHCYFKTSASMNFSGALSTCTAAGGYPAVLSSLAENTTVSTYIDEWAWIGISDEGHEGDWRYSYGEKANQQFYQDGVGTVGGNFYTWSNYEPNMNTNANCGTIVYHGWGDVWRTDNCSSGSYKALCEIDGSPNPADLSNKAAGFLKANGADICPNGTAGSGPFNKVGSVKNVAEIYTMWQQGGFLFAGTPNDGLQVYSLDGNNVPTPLTSISPERIVDVRGDGTYIFAMGADTNTVYAYTFNGTSFTLINSITLSGNSGYGNRLAAGQGYLYVNNGSNGIKALTFDGSGFMLVASYDTPGESAHIWADNKFIYISEGWGNKGIRIMKFDGLAFTQAAYAPVNAGMSWGDGKYLYVLDTDAVRAYSFDGTTLINVANFATDATRIITGDGTNIYLQSGYYTRILRVIRFDGTNFTSVGEKNIETATVNSLYVDGDNLYVGYNYNSGALSGQIDTFSGFGCRTSGTPSPAIATPVDIYQNRIASGYDFSCAIKPDTTVWCWGTDQNERLGNGAVLTADQTTPTQVVNSFGAVQVTAGANHACMIKSDGSLWCWGQDFYGQLGNGSADNLNQPVPVQVDAGSTWTQIGAGDIHTCGIKNDGSAWCWGFPGEGRIGNNGGYNSDPQLVSDPGPWSSIDGGGGHTCGIKTDGSAWCWGGRVAGAIGDGLLSPNANIPTLVAEPGPWANIATGYLNTCGVKLDGSAWCWGSNYYGQSALGNAGAVSAFPHKVADPGPWVSIRMAAQTNGYSGTACGIKTDGTAWCWGASGSGQVGNGQGGLLIPPSQVADPGPWAGIDAGTYHTCGIKADGSVWCWGSDDLGNLGNGAITTGNQNYPVRVSNFPDIASWQWDGTGRTITAAGTANLAMSTTTGISYDGTSVSAVPNGLSFPSAGRTILRQNPGSSELLIDASNAGYSSQLSWKTLTAANTRSLGIDYTTASLEFGVNNATPSLFMNAIAPQMEITATGNVGIGTTGTAAARLDVNGGIRLGTDAATCTLLKKGVLRYTSGVFEYCNGSAWAAF
jgi:alpha-tubulin suppressor-like RCC1 family protein